MPLVLILPKMSRYFKTFCMGDERLLEKYKTIWTKIEDSNNVELSALPIYDNRYIKTKIRTHGDKVYTNLCGLNVPEFLQSFLLILSLFMRTNIIYKYI